MSIDFFPLGIPLSSSYAQKAAIVKNLPVGTIPVTASLAEYISNYIGPTGSVYETINATGLI